MRFSAMQSSVPPDPRTETSSPEPVQQRVMSADRKKRLELLKNQELLGVSTEPEKTKASSISSVPRENSGKPGAAPASQKPSSGAGTNTRSHRPINSYAAAAQALRGGTQTPHAAGGTSTANAASGSSSGFTVPGGNATQSAVSQGAATQQTSYTFAPFLRGLTREQSEMLNSTLDGLSSRVERAILQASLPKSKKDANIEKYLKRNQTQTSTQTATANGPFAGVINQVASQKDSVVQSMKQAYGVSAGAAAGKLMDAYQNEISSVLENKDGKTQEELAKQAQAVSQKYNKKLSKMGEKYGLRKFKQENQAKDREFLDDVEKTYGSDISSQMADLRLKALEQKMQLAQEPGLTSEEAYKKYLDIESNLWKEEENLLLSNGYSPSKLQTLKNEKDERERALRAQEEQAGKRVAQVFRMSKEDQDAYISNMEQKIIQPRQQNDVLAYGEEGAKQFKPVYDRYLQEIKQIVADEETSQDEKEAALQQASENAKKEITRLKNTPQMREQQVSTALDRIFQDPSLKKATPAQRQAYEQFARPILSEMFEQAAQIEQSNLSEPEKRRQLKALDEETRRKLSGGL